jgi:hypothetical protein
MPLKLLWHHTAKFFWDFIDFTFVRENAEQWCLDDRWIMMDCRWNDVIDRNVWWNMDWLSRLRLICAYHDFVILCQAGKSLTMIGYRPEGRQVRNMDSLSYVCKAGGGTMDWLSCIRLACTWQEIVIMCKLACALHGFSIIRKDGMCVTWIHWHSSAWKDYHVQG